MISCSVLTVTHRGICIDNVRMDCPLQSRFIHTIYTCSYTALYTAIRPIAVRETSIFLGIIGAQLRAPETALPPQQYRILKGLMRTVIWAPIMSRDAGLSDRYTSDRCFFQPGYMPVAVIILVIMFVLKYIYIYVHLALQCCEQSERLSWLSAI